MKESDGRNLKMANRGNQGKVYKKINAKFASRLGFLILGFLPSDNLTKIDLLSKIMNRFTNFLMLRKALMALSNVANKLSNKILCQTIVYWRYTNCIFIFPLGVEFRSQGQRDRGSGSRVPFGLWGITELVPKLVSRGRTSQFASKTQNQMLSS